MRKTILLLALLPLSLGAVAAEKKAAPPPDPVEDPLLITAGFLTHHPDLKYRMLGMEAYKEKRFDDALRYFRRASFFADKPSQGMVAEMYWNGEGAPQDRALAYAWMDLAAERGYAGFLGLRERYWNALSAAERERATTEGQDVYARFGDEAAKPRYEFQLRTGRRNVTGSRTGFTGNLQILVPGPAGEQSIPGSKFYDERYWDAKKYWAWQDNVWMKPAIGRVDVGDVEVVREGEPPKVDSRIPETRPQVDAPVPEVPDEPAPKPTP